MIKLSKETLLILNNLTPREEELLRKRNQVSMDAADKEFIFSREQIKRIEENALRKLRRTEPPDDIA